MSEHILAFGKTPDNRFGGQERSLFEMCRGVAQEGMKVTFVYREPGNLVPRYEEFCEATYHFPHLYRYAPAETVGFLQGLATMFWRHQRHDWDVLYVNQYADTTLPAVLSLLIRRPLVCHLRLPAPNYLSRQWRWGLRQCERLIPISEQTAASYEEKGLRTDTMRVVHNGINTSYFAPREREYDGMRWVTYLGRLNPQKGLDDLLDAHERIAAERDDVGLRIVGGKTATTKPPSYGEQLEQKAEEYDGTVEFIPHQQDVRPVLAQSDVLVLPSKWGEPFGRVLIEAMSAGIPVVGTRDGGIPEVLSPDFEEHLVPPGNAGALADKILDVIDWRDEQPELGTRAREYVQRRFSEERTVQDMKEVFLDVAP